MGVRRILVHLKPGGLGNCEYDLLVRAGGAQWPSGNSFKQRPGRRRLVHLSLGPDISVVFTMHPFRQRNGDNLFLICVGILLEGVSEQVLLYVNGLAASSS